MRVRSLKLVSHNGAQRRHVGLGEETFFVEKAVARLPSSHASPGSRMPSPQVGSWQLLRQLSVLTWLPSSHVSPGSTRPLPTSTIASLSPLRGPPADMAHLRYRFRQPISGLVVRLELN